MNALAGDVRIIIRAIVIVAFAVTACDKNSEAQPDVLSLLRLGNNKACSAGDVHQVVENLLAPQKPPGLGPDSDQYYLQARNSLSFNYNTSTMDNYEKTTSSMVCSTNIVAKEGNTDTGDQRVNFKVQPTSDGDSSFAVVLTSDDADAKTAILNLVGQEAGRLQQVAAANATKSAAVMPPAESANVITNTNTPAFSDDSSTDNSTSQLDDPNNSPPPPPAAASSSTSGSLLKESRLRGGAGRL